MLPDMSAGSLNRQQQSNSCHGKIRSQMMELRVTDNLVEDGLIQRILRYERLTAVFQPVFSLADDTPFGFEGLIRGPEQSAVHRPDQLFAAAEKCCLRSELELLAARTILRQFAAKRLPGFIFVNFSCKALFAAGRALEQLTQQGVSPSCIMLELTEHDYVSDIGLLRELLRPLTASGVSIVLDDFGDGHSNLRLWKELRPRIVKLDRFFIHGIAGDGDRFEIVRLLSRLADSFGTQVVAEGIEEESDLAVVKDLHIPLGQGYLLGMPDTDPAVKMSPIAASVLRSSKLSVLPELAVPSKPYTFAGELLISVPGVDWATTGDALARIFSMHPEYPAVAVIKDEQPVGIISRRSFMERYAQPFQRELYGHRSCEVFMNTAPHIVDRRTPLEVLKTMLTGQDQRYLNDGFIIVDNGRYIGLGTGESLVRAVTERRIEAARYANPLTFLPGNIPISQHLERLLAAKVPFVGCYADLNNFKPFNDQYGYWRGDLVIKLAAALIVKHADPMADFVGHVGGDDFFIIFQSEDWQQRCERTILEFNEQVKVHFAKSDAAQGGFWGEDRKGGRCYFPLTTLSIGAVRVRDQNYADHEQVASAAAVAKRKAKGEGSGLVLLDKQTTQQSIAAHH